MSTISSEKKLWDAYHELLLGPDTSRIKKLLVRYDMYRLSKDISGDVLECGVFKGAGLMYWLKVLSACEPESAKKVIGFDSFKFFAGPLTEKEKGAAQSYMEESGVQEISPDTIYGYAKKAGLRDRVELVAGDITRTAQEYVNAHPEFVISFLHLDLDTYHGTKAALEAFYPRISPGGVIVFDEYGDADWDETKAVDEYFSDKNEQVQTISRSSKPSAYLIKKVTNTRKGKR